MTCALTSRARPQTRDERIAALEAHVAALAQAVLDAELRLAKFVMAQMKLNTQQVKINDGLIRKVEGDPDDDAEQLPMAVVH